MADGDIVRSIKITATGENIDSTTASVKSLGDATDGAGKSAQSSGLYWIDLNAKLELAQKAYNGVSAAANGASASVGGLTTAVTNGASSNELKALADKFNSIWQDGINKLNSYVELSAKAGSLGTDYYQRLVKGATDAQKPADEYLKIIQNINTALDRKLGSNGLQNGSTFNTEVVDLQKNGNLQAQTADVNRLNNSVTGKEQLDAALKLIQGAVDAGEKLVAFKLTNTLLGPEAAANLKLDNDYIFQIQKSIADVAAKDITKQPDIDRAVALKTALDDATKYIDSWFTKSKSDWSSLGIEIQQLWVNAATNIESVLKLLDSIFSRTKDIAGVKAPSDSIFNSVSGYFTKGLTPDQIQSQFGVTPLDDAGRQKEIALQTLASQLGNKNNVTNARQQTQKADDFLTPDKSKASAKDVNEVNDAVDRAINALTRHVEAQKADALAIGLGDGALASFRAEASETAAVLANGGKETDKQADAFQDLQEKASAAADALAKAKVASAISRGAQTAFLSPEDVSIANQLKGIYGDDIPRALASSEAAALRFNDAMKSINDLARQTGASFANDLVSGILAGKTAMESLTSAANNLGKSLTTAGINNIIKDPTSGVGYIEAGIGIFTQLITGKNPGKEAANAAAAAQTAQNNASAADRRQQDTASAQLAGIDQTSLSGQLAGFDIGSQQQRLAEAKAGNGAIVELEKSLAAQRQAIIDKSNQAIAKSMTDFLNSIKTGSLSTLSAGDQLAYEQNLFNTQLAGAKGGNSTDLNSLTTTAQALLTLAQNFYASGTGYADVYKNVTSAITSIANGPGQSASLDAGKTGYTVDGSSGNAYDGHGHLSTTTIAAYASGGIVQNGRYGVDSVTARLAGGEHVTRSSSVNANTIGALNQINRTGQAPGGNNAEVVRVLTQGFNGQTVQIVDAINGLSDRMKRIEDVTRQGQTQRRVPGTKAA